MKPQPSRGTSMQPLNAVLPDTDPAPLILPRPALNLALRVLQLMAGAQHLAFQVVTVDNVWYLVIPGGGMERLG